MTLEEFAQKCGMEVFDCDPMWGGRFGYRTKDHPDISFCGYKTERSAHLGWLASTFGATAAPIVKKLLADSEKHRKRP